MIESTATVPTVLNHLEAVCTTRGVDALADHLASLRLWIASDLIEVDNALGAIDQRDTPVCNTARHLLSSGGKRLRPLCVALASRAGTGFSPAARELATAVEMVHCATLLHDDVVDLGEQRRGVPAARIVYGNAASIFGGDWLLVEALGRIRRAGLPDVFDRILSVLQEMLLAESLQLQNRGVITSDPTDYFRVAEGKTASLFRWALYSGARAGNCPAEHCDAFEKFGHHIGVAFQLVDDVLDVSGDADIVGKSLFVDVREGKMSHPLLLALGSEPQLRDVLQRVESSTEAENGSISPEIASEIGNSLRRTGAIEGTISLARHHCATAIESLSRVPTSTAKEALVAVAQSVMDRRK